MSYSFLRRGFRLLGYLVFGRELAKQTNLREFGRVVGLELKVDPNSGNLEHNSDDAYKLSVRDLRLIDEYVQTLHQNADWYNHKVFKELWKQRMFLGVSIVLLFAIPVAIAWGIPWLMEDKAVESQASVVAAQIVALLSGVIGLQRSFGAWLANRRLLGQRWRARTNLINLIYEIDNEYRYKFQDAVENAERTKTKNALMRDLRAAIKSARIICDEETQLFFDRYTLPQIDLGNSLLSANTVAAKIYEQLREPVDSVLEANRMRTAERLRIEAELRETVTEIDYLQARFEKLDREMPSKDQADQMQMTAQEREIFLRQVAELTELETEIAQKQNRRLNLLLEQHVQSIDQAK